MASHVESSSSTLEANIVDRASQFGFEQLMTMLDSCFDFENAVIRLQANSAAAFPVTDVAAAKYCEQRNGRVVTIALNFMGLYGVDSPLPSYFTVLAHQDNEAGQCLRDFLDIFHQGLYFLFYKVWRRYCPTAYSLNNSARTILAEYQPNNMAQLHQHLLENFPALSFQVTGFIPKWQTLDTSTSLASTSHLGEMLLGQRFYDATSHLQIRLNLETLSALRSYFPGLPTSQALSRQIAHYLEPLFTFELIYCFSLSEQSPSSLGSQYFYLGWLTLLGSPNMPHYKIIYPSDSLIR